MSENVLDDLIKMPPVDLMGPAMRKLNPRQQRFVVALQVLGGRLPDAYRWAGFNVTNDNSASAAASRLHNATYIKEAMHEEAVRTMHMLKQRAVWRVGEALESGDHRVAMEAAKILLNRTGLNEKTEHHVVVEHKRSPEELLKIINAAQMRLGLPAPLPIIDVEAEDAEMSSEGLEDLL